MVHETANRFMAAHPRAVGMSIGILAGGQTYRYNFGTMARGAPAQATAGTRYPIASITKTFTAALLAQADAEGKLRMQDDVRKYLDGAYPNLAYGNRGIRLFDLLDHRSGLPFFLPDRPEAQPDDAGSTVPFLTRLARLRQHYNRVDFMRDLHQVRLTTAPGDEPPHYSNAGAELVGYVLERVYARPYVSLLQAEIVSPLGMTSTCMANACPGGAPMPEGYDKAGRRLPDDTAPLGAAGALKSSVDDLLKYMRWQHDETNPAVRISHGARVTLGAYSVGLNWQMWLAHGVHLIWQSGNVPGFGSLCLDERELGIQMVVLMNGVDDATTDGKEELVNDILAQLDRRAVPLP